MERLRDWVRIYGEKMEKKIKKKRKQSDDGRGGERERDNGQMWSVGLNLIQRYMM